MNITAYIESGAIESYILGLSDQNDILEIEQLRNKYPEVEQAIDDFSISLEEHAFKNAITPPAAIKGQLMATLKFQNASLDDDHTPMVVAYNSNLTTEPAATNITSINGRWKYLAAASIILLVVSAISNLLLYNQYSSTKDQYAALLNERNSLQASNQVYQTSIKNYQSATEMMADPTIAIIQLKDPAHIKNDLTTIFWDTKTKDVYLLANKLPTPNKDQQYQLWALVDGKPVDAGMLDPQCSSLCKMKNIPKAQAFAITREKTGGSATPTMDQLFMMGSI